MNLFKYFVIGIMCFSLTGCGTLFTQSAASIKLIGTPGAKIKDENGKRIAALDNAGRGTFIYRRSMTNPTYIVSKKGYEDLTFQVDTGVNWGWLIVEGLFFWPGLIVDGVTGGFRSVNDTVIDCDLEISE